MRLYWFACDAAEGNVRLAVAARAPGPGDGISVRVSGMVIEDLDLAELMARKLGEAVSQAREQRERARARRAPEQVSDVSRGSPP